MTVTLIAALALAVAAIAAVLAARSLWRRHYRRRLRDAALPTAKRRILETKVDLYRRLPEHLKRELEGHVQVFLAEKSFEGCGGMVVDDEVRLRIAAQACVLLLGNDRNYFPELASVLVYPSAFVVPREQHTLGSMEFDAAYYDDLGAGDELHIGESSSSGTVVLAWDAVASAGRRKGDGLNVILHEFAHQLDLGNGIPDLQSSVDESEWYRALGDVYEEVTARVEQGKPTFLDEYGAGDPAEFFAVATEAFFIQPADLKKRHRPLYDALSAFYSQDPTAW